MFRPIRRSKKEISQEAARRLLASQRRGILAMNGDDGYPYAIPINFWYCEEENQIYFHGARVGYKAELLGKDHKVCFTVCGEETVRDEPWAPYVQSAVVFGQCTAVEDPAEAMRLVRRLAEKYYPSKELIDAEIESAGRAVQMFRIQVEHLSGKEIQEK